MGTVVRVSISTVQNVGQRGTENSYNVLILFTVVNINTKTSIRLTPSDKFKTKNMLRSVFMHVCVCVPGNAGQVSDDVVKVFFRHITEA